MLKVQVEKRIGHLDMKIAFQIEKPCITVFFGKSGTGKTTLAKMLAGLVRPDKGFISFKDNVFFDSRISRKLPPEKCGVGYVFQEHRLFPHLSVKNNLTFGCSFGGRRNGISVDQVVELLGIDHLLNRHPETLSGGESQRVALGRALLGCTSFLLMDEPLSSLDNQRRDDLMVYIASIPKEFSLPMIYITHNREEVAKLADRVLLIKEGKLAAYGNPDEVMELAAGINEKIA
ncbi:MAG: ATP-binding cassette domain-containing protein [Smithellaceae bacterium]|nr:ATP-binding cassette domain-containing protein [Smithellaceae bacterium]